MFVLDGYHLPTATWRSLTKPSRRVCRAMDAAAGRLRRLRPELRLWLLVLCFFVLGDLLTTVVGLGMPGVVETNPVVVSALLEPSLSTMVALKLATLAGAVAVWTGVPRPHSLGVPLGLAALGVVATGWNLAIVVVALVG